MTISMEDQLNPNTRYFKLRRQSGALWEWEFEIKGHFLTSDSQKKTITIRQGYFSTPEAALVDFIQWAETVVKDTLFDSFKGRKSDPKSCPHQREE